MEALESSAWSLLLVALLVVTGLAALLSPRRGRGRGELARRFYDGVEACGAGAIFAVSVLPCVFVSVVLGLRRWLPFLLDDDGGSNYTVDELLGFLIVYVSTVALLAWRRQ
jgi:hypothetical protein